MSKDESLFYEKLYELINKYNEDNKENNKSD